MKHSFTCLIVLLAVVSIYSCQKEESLKINISNNLIGYWLISENESIENKIIYEKKHGFHQDKYGLAFQKNDKFIIRQNSGWCGTPPVTLHNALGSWTYQDSIIRMETDNRSWQYRVISVDKNKLIVERN